jgi:hypothetical protein
LPVKTIWPITYARGHREHRDLSAKRADQRASYANWLAQKDCTDCWRASQGETSERLSKDEWLAQRRAEEAATVTDWEQRAGMSTLFGSEKAVDWARRCRHALLTATFETLVQNGDLPEDIYVEQIEAPARLIDRASWWIDNRDADPSDVAELVDAARGSDAVTSENDL